MQLKQQTTYFASEIKQFEKQARRRRVNTILLDDKLLVCSPRTVNNVTVQYRSDITTISSDVYDQLKQKFPTLKKTTRRYKRYPVGTLYISNPVKPLFDDNELEELPFVSDKDLRLA